MRILMFHSQAVDPDQRTWRDHGAGIQTNSDVLETDSDSRFHAAEGKQKSMTIFTLKRTAIHILA